MAGMPNGWNARRSVNQASLDRIVKYRSSEHQRARRYWDKQIKAGGVCCWRCQGELDPDARWHLGHDDYDTDVIRGPEHPACNVKAAARKGYRAQQAAKQAARFVRPIR